MNDRDTRPLHSPMPAHLIPVFERHAPQTWDRVMAVFSEVMDAAATAQQRPPAELVNDALSMQAQIAATAMFAFALKLAEAKNVDLRPAMEVAIAEVVMRARLSVDLAETSRDSRTATRQ